METAQDLAIDPTDPYAREAQIFPRPGEEQARRVAGYGTEDSLAGGKVVFARGRRSVDLFLVLDGAIEIFNIDARGQPKPSSPPIARAGYRREGLAQ